MTEASSPIRSILIVGGGTAGWMTAAYLARYLRLPDCQITLVESATIGTIGVGEATIPALVGFVRNLRLDEDQFMRKCNATYKLGIQFIDWIEKGHKYWHPFGLCGGLIEGQDLYHYWLRAQRVGAQQQPYAAFSLQARLAELNKSPRPLGGMSQIIGTGAYAYHLDARALADLLREVATSAGVAHLHDEVQAVELDDRRAIARIHTQAARQLAADLYIDATGFQGLLIEKALGDAWVDWSDQLLCNRAVVAQFPRDEEQAPYTRSTALDAGWMWQIPLSNRTGCGYVYSNRHLNDDAAGAALLAAAPAGQMPSADLRYLPMRIGRRQHGWVGNCVSIGLASGFLEPLESTGIYFVQRALDLLTTYFPDRKLNHVLRQAYNQAIASSYEEVRDFILLHYVLSRRDDQAFWRDCRHVPQPDSLRHLRELYEESGYVASSHRTVFSERSYHHICSGGGCFPRRHHPSVEAAEMREVTDVMRQIQRQNEDFCQTMPSHAELMAWLHGPEC